MDEDTFGGYQCGIESSIYPYFADKGYTLADLEQNPQLIKDYYDYKMDTRKVKANTVIHRHANIRKALQELYVDGIINNNPADRIKKSPLKRISLLTFTILRNWIRCSRFLKGILLN